MKIAIVPSLRLCNRFIIRDPDIRLPLGALSLAASLRKGGISVDIVDFNVINMKSDFVSDSFPMAAAETLLKGEYALIGFTTLSDSYPIVLKIVEKIKLINPNVFTVLGGPQASVTDREVLINFKDVDFIVRGEGETTFTKLCHNIAISSINYENILGLSYRKGETIIQNNPLDNSIMFEDMPQPAYDLYPIDELICKKRLNVIDIETGRGCKFNCSFCIAKLIWGNFYRIKPINNIIEDILYFTSKYKNIKFEFVHDLFGVDVQWTEKLCNELKGMDIKWSASCRVDQINKELLNRMSSAGCKVIYYGYESASPFMQNNIKKNLKVESVPQILKDTVESGIEPSVSFIIGFPEEGIQDIEETIEAFFKSSIIGEGKLHILVPHVKTKYQKEFSLHYDMFSEDGLAYFHNDTYDYIIRSYPQVFSNYYFIENSNLPRETIKGLYVFSSTCSSPATILSLKYWKGYNIYTLYKMINKYYRGYVEQRDHLKSSEYSVIKYRKRTEHIINKLVEKCNIEWIKDIYRYELSVSMLSNIDIDIMCNENIPSNYLVKNPITRKDIIIDNYYFSIEDIIHQVIFNKTSISPMNIKNNKILYRTNRGVSSLSINDTMVSFLELANGSRTTGDIVRKVSRREDMITTRETIKKLFNHGIISFI